MAEKIIENGDIYFFYRPKVQGKEARELDDMQNFYIVMVPEQPKRFRLMEIEQKCMPSTASAGTPSKGQGYAVIEYVAESGEDLLDERLAWGESVSGEPAHSAIAAGAARYLLYLNEGRAEMTYFLKAPMEPGPVQEVFNIGQEGAFAVKINPSKRLESSASEPGQERHGHRGQREVASGSWGGISDGHDLDYESIRILLVCIDVHDTRDQFSINEFKKEEAFQAIYKLYRDLNLDLEGYPIEPLTKGDWPEKTSGP